MQCFELFLGSCPFVAERRISSARSAHEAEVDDIINIFDILDTADALNGFSSSRLTWRVCRSTTQKK
jgi:hypothetical protein